VDVPIVIRLGGNAEDKAVEILESLNGRIPTKVEGYKKDDSPDFCAARLDALIQEARGKRPEERITNYESRTTEPPNHLTTYSFETVTGGTVTYDHAICATCESKVCIEACAMKILTLNEAGCPVLNITPAEAKKGRCSECLGCEVDCLLYGAGGGRIELPIVGLDR
jgi:hypothetical protein